MSKPDLKFVIGLFIFIILGVTLIGVVANNIYDNTQTYSVTNERFTCPQNNTAVILAKYPIVSGSLTLGNSTNYSITLTNFTINYVTGSLTYVGDAAYNGTGNSFRANYSFYSGNYVYDSTSRTILSLITLLFSIAIVVFAFVKLNEKFEFLNFK
jgi:hypothetical protein